MSVATHHPLPGLSDLDAAATLAAAESTMRARRAAEVHDLLVVAHWADLHSDPAPEDPDRPLRTTSGVARVEDLGPQLVERLAELLGHADVRLQPVRDLNGRIRVDQYEHPEALKDHTWHLSGGDAFPYAPPAHRAVVDHDHPTPYDKDGPPGQTGNHNSAPLRRTHHRWKTFGGYRCRQAGPGRYLWATPHGHYYLRDHTGTHRLDPDDGELILEAPSGVDIYPT